MRLILLRHAETDWNAAGRIQGRTDTQLNEKGIRSAANWSLPTSITPTRWVTSPQRRAAETAKVMGVESTTEACLIEMDWGEWEGQTLAELRLILGTTFSDNEARGLDFTPPGGESPRMVQERLIPWLQGLAAETNDVGAISHKGVIRAIIALATGWDMMGKSPASISSGSAQVISISAAGTLKLEASDIRLTEERDPDDVD